MDKLNSLNTLASTNKILLGVLMVAFIIFFAAFIYMHYDKKTFTTTINILVFMILGMCMIIIYMGYNAYRSDTIKREIKDELLMKYKTLEDFNKSEEKEILYNYNFKLLKEIQDYIEINELRKIK